ncbi:hypothetical protein VNI00_016599 [Paramarasmius palmivorus]|uniref:DUF6535 domain-containing protein n=1 Tax=Paramarasmius palmivorus TaxID=297713 RepID=A0AAW0BD24_9AGAR
MEQESTRENSDGSRNLEEAWEKLIKETNKYDDDMVKNWKEDIDTLLVFAGLFSAVVTAFAIESYQWLLEDSTDTTNTLLLQISKQLANTTVVVDVPQPTFQPSSSSVRINALWFLSLVLSLTSGLFGLLCKQWLREHRRDTPTRSQAETLALRELRNASFQKRAISSFLAMPPILLEIALLLFLAGVLELLWTLHIVPFSVVAVAVGCSAGLYLVTTVLPPLTMFGLAVVPSYISDRFNDHIHAFHNICPYKSPQAWWLFWFCSKVVRHSSTAKSFFAKRNRTLIRMRDWSMFDLSLVRRASYTEDSPSTSWSYPVEINVYKLQALRSVITMFRDSPSMVTHIQTIVLSLPPALIMATALDFWSNTVWEEVTPSDVQYALVDDIGYFHAKCAGSGVYCYGAPDPPNMVLHSKPFVRLLYHQQYWLSLANNLDPTIAQELLSSIEEYMQLCELHPPSIRFLLPFPVAAKVWIHPNVEVRREGRRLIQIYEDTWRAHLGPEEEWDQRLAFIVTLARHKSPATATWFCRVNFGGRQLRPRAQLPSLRQRPDHRARVIRVPENC